MSVDDVRPGMTGFGVTVFEGIKRERFGVEILGVLKNVMGPKRDIIIARLSKGPLTQTGVIQGMSGSPVYIDKKLIGAISYSLGSFPKEPIAGITPIDEMLFADANRKETRTKAQLEEFPLSSSKLKALFTRRFITPDALSQISSNQTIGLPDTQNDAIPDLLRPIATPVIMAGFEPTIKNLWSSVFGTAQFTTSIGGAQPFPENTLEPIQAGDAVGAALIRGDLTMVGTGTVTLVENDRVYAFGHPFYNLGPISFPMTRASVTTVLPSLALSSKITSIGNVIGTLDQDRATGIFGSLGEGPSMIPVNLSFRSTDRGFTETFSFEIIRDPLFSPLLSYTGILSTFLSWSRQLGNATYSLDVEIDVAKNENVVFSNIFSGERALTEAADAVLNPVNTLLNNRIESAVIDGIGLRIESSENAQIALLERAWLDPPRLTKGSRHATVNVLAKTNEGSQIFERVPITIPLSASGTLSLTISDAKTLSGRELLPDFPDQRQTSLNGIIRRFNKTRRNDSLFIQLVSNEAGMLLNGTTMPSLPPSVLGIIESSSETNGADRIQQAILKEWEVGTSFPITGSRSIPIVIETP
tara:strand:- start:6013 stop:7767 length:1755 start_codon:yes stop_codon:yes gene_type:complete